MSGDSECKSLASEKLSAQTAQAHTGAKNHLPTGESETLSIGQRRKRQTSRIPGDEIGQLILVEVQLL